MDGKLSYLTKSQMRKLHNGLKDANNRDQVLTLTEIEGFLHALVITPDMVRPGEWLPVIFDGEPEFRTENGMTMAIEALFSAYNTYENARSKNLLRFPFDLMRFSVDMLDEIHQWCYGFMEALSLRPEIWFLSVAKDAESFDDLPETEASVASGIVAIGTLAYPDKFIEIIDEETSASEILSSILSVVPDAVEALQAYGNTLWKQKLQQMHGGVFDFNPARKKVGRNDPCPCGSGKKYKKCCGRN